MTGLAQCLGEIVRGLLVVFHQKNAHVGDSIAAKTEGQPLTKKRQAELACH